MILLLHIYEYMYDFFLSMRLRFYSKKFILKMIILSVFESFAKINKFYDAIILNLKCVFKNI